MSDSQQFLLTGAAGFTGSHLLTSLLNSGEKVRAMVRSAENFFNAPHITAEIKTHSNLEVVIGDLLKPETLASAVSGVAGIYHIAAAFREAGKPDSYYHAVNAQGTRLLLEAAIKANVPRCIVCSTNGVVSKPTHLPSDETDSYSPGDVYQASKVEAEKIALNFFAEGKIHGMVLRPAMIYGPHDYRLLKLFKLIGERRFVYIGDGNRHVHFIDVRDLAKAFILAMNHKEINGEVVLIAGERPFKLKEVVKEIARCYEVPVPRVKIPVTPIQILGSLCELICAPFKVKPPIYRRRVDFFVKERCFSTRKAQVLLNFSPMHTTFQEIQELCLWYEKEGFVKPKRS